MPPAKLKALAGVEDVLSRAHACITSIAYAPNGRNAVPGAHPVSLITVDPDGFPAARTIVPLDGIPRDLKVFPCTFNNESFHFSLSLSLS